MTKLNLRKIGFTKLPIVLLLVCSLYGCKFPESTSPSTLLTAAAEKTLNSVNGQTEQTFTRTSAPTTYQTTTPFPVATLTQKPTTTSIISPTPPLSQQVRLAIIGDYGAGGKAAEDVANSIKSWGVDYILTTGDNNYPVGAWETIDRNIGKYYHEYIFPYKGEFGEGADENRFYPTLGNHDWDTDNAKPYLEYFTLPGNERYYDVVLGPVHIFALNSDYREPDGVGQSDIQGQWLQEQLANSNYPWKLVIYHAAAYSSGYQGSTEWMRWPYQEWGATAAIAGHDHLYERLEINGFPYFTNGIGGGAIYDFINILPESQVRYNDEYGAMLITADELQITFQFININGEIIDTYQITLNG